MGKHRQIGLTRGERESLEQLIRPGNAPARANRPARILPLSERSQGQMRSDAEVADAVLCSVNTASNVRRRYVKEGLQAALAEMPRPGAAPKFTGAIDAQLTMLACSQPPEGQRTANWQRVGPLDTHWWEWYTFIDNVIGHTVF